MKKQQKKKNKEKTLQGFKEKGASPVRSERETR